MNQRGRNTRNTKKESGEEKQHRNLPRVAVPWGRGASAWRPGLLLRKHFEEHPETCCADAYYSLSQQIESLNEERAVAGEKPLKRPNYSSFSRYFHSFLILGLIERTGKVEASVYPFLQKRVFYRLTDRGRTEVRAWQDPIRVLHPEFR
jgi:hypothetical protein